MDDPNLFTQIQHGWQAMAATLSASVASAWAMIKAHTRRLDRIDQKVDKLEQNKATRQELKAAIERVQQSNNRIYQRIDDLYMILLSKADERVTRTINKDQD